MGGNLGCDWKKAVMPRMLRGVWEAMVLRLKVVLM
jgi:hypothetical protein